MHTSSTQAAGLPYLLPDSPFATYLGRTDSTSPDARGRGRDAGGSPISCPSCHPTQHADSTASCDRKSNLLRAYEAAEARVWKERRCGGKQPSRYGIYHIYALVWRIVVYTNGFKAQSRSVRCVYIVLTTRPIVAENSTIDDLRPRDYTRACIHAPRFSVRPMPSGYLP